MRNRYLALSVLFLAAQLQGCSATAQSEPSIIDAWQVQRIAAQVLPVDSGLTLTFDKDKRAHGNGGCNMFQGSYDVQGNDLTFGPLAATRMACPTPQMEVEQLFFRNLAKVASYQLEGNTLNLLARDGGVVVVLRQTK
jgi:heat shock protein HslJ